MVNGGRPAIVIVPAVTVLVVVLVMVQDTGSQWQNVVVIEELWVVQVVQVIQQSTIVEVGIIEQLTVVEQIVEVVREEVGVEIGRLEQADVSYAGRCLVSDWLGAECGTRRVYWRRLVVRYRARIDGHVTLFDKLPRQPPAPCKC